MCSFDKTKLVLYLFNELTVYERKGVESHVRSCNECEFELVQLKSSFYDYNALQPIDPPVLQFAGESDRKKLVGQHGKRIKIRKLMPAFGLAILIIMMITAVFWFVKPNRTSSYWSLENSWEGPYQYHFKSIDHTVEMIKNDKFFK